jgi:hypothetical protein
LLKNIFTSVYLFLTPQRNFFTVLSVTATSPADLVVDNCITDLSDYSALTLEGWYYTFYPGTGDFTRITLGVSKGLDKSSCLTFLLQFYPLLIVSTNSKLGLCMSTITPINTKISILQSSLCDDTQIVTNHLFKFEVILPPPPPASPPPTPTRKNTLTGIPDHK